MVERFRDELGDWRLAVHSPFGAQVHQPWALAIAARVRERLGLEAQVMHTDDGLTLIDGGWSIEVARDLLERCLRDVGYGFGDIKRFLVTHVHRDHFTLATVLGHEYGADVAQLVQTLEPTE